MVHVDTFHMTMFWKCSSCSKVWNHSKVLPLDSSTTDIYPSTFTPQTLCKFTVKLKKECQVLPLKQHVLAPSVVEHIHTEKWLLTTSSQQGESMVLILMHIRVSLRSRRVERKQDYLYSTSTLICDKKHTHTLANNHACNANLATPHPPEQTYSKYLFQKN